VDVSGGELPESWRSGRLLFRPSALPADPLAPGAPGDRAPHWVDGFFIVPRLPALDADGGAA
jgi:hypothetical protein